MATRDDILALYQGILRREPSTAEIEYWEEQVESGAVSPEELFSAFTQTDEAQTAVEPVIKLYSIAFGRVPDAAGLDYWVSQLVDGASLDDVLAAFTGSAEFAERFGGEQGSEELISAFYQNALGREPDAEGLQYWLEQGLSADELLREFADSDEFDERSDAPLDDFYEDVVAGEEDAYEGPLVPGDGEEEPEEPGGPGGPGGPGAPSVAITGIADDTGGSDTDGVTSDVSLTLSGTADAEAEIVLFDGENEVGEASADEDGEWSVELDEDLDDGDYELVAKAVDEEGNTVDTSNPFAVTVDTADPDVDVDVASFDEDGLTVSGTSDGAARLTVSISGPGLGEPRELGNVNADGEGNWSLNLAAGDEAFADLEGDYKVAVEAEDLAGNSATAEADSDLAIDFVGPDEPVIDGIDAEDDTGSQDDDGVTNAETITLRGTTEADASVTLYKDRHTVVETVTADSEGEWSYEFDGENTLEEDAYTFTAIARDAQNNPSDESDGYDVVIDRTDPSDLSVDAKAGTVGVGDDVVLTGSVQGAAYVDVYLDDDKVGSASVEGGDFTFTDEAIENAGTLDYEVKAYDLAGNVATAIESVTVEDSGGGEPNLAGATVDYNGDEQTVDETTEFDSVLGGDFAIDITEDSIDLSYLGVGSFNGDIEDEIELVLSDAPEISGLGAIEYVGQSNSDADAEATYDDGTNTVSIGLSGLELDEGGSLSIPVQFA